MLSARHASLLRCAVWLIVVVATSLALPACGVNDTTTPPVPEYFPLPPEFHVKDEFFIAVRPEPQFPELLGSPQDVVRAALECLYDPPPNGKPCEVSKGTADPLHIIGCGGGSDRGSYEFEDQNLFCVRLPNPERDLPILLRNRQIRYIEAHGRVIATGVQVCPGSWGLDRIDQRPDERLNGVYSYQYTGKGVHIYLVDTGISDVPIDNRAGAMEFGPRLGAGFYASEDMITMKTEIVPTGSNVGEKAEDCVGHGTFLAGIIGARTAGVAKDAILHPVRIIGTKTACPAMSTDKCINAGNLKSNAAVVIKAFKEIRDDHKRRASSNEPLSIAMLPFMTEFKPSDTLDKEVEKLVSSGIVVVTGAGNHTDPMDTKKWNAGDYSPARVRGAITVGAFDELGRFAEFSNEGSAIDLLAPGSGIRSIVPEERRNTCTEILSGTSISAAFTAGVVAQILEANKLRFTGKEDPVTVATGILMKSAIHGIPGSPAIRNVPDQTPDVALRSPYGTGVTGDQAEKDKIDPCNDAVSFLSCPENSSCEVYGFCGGFINNRCCNGLESSEECGRGVRCSEGKCESCGLRGERCCAGDKRCASSLLCQAEVCVGCGQRNEPCCVGDLCGSNLECLAKEKEKEKVCVCGDNGQKCCKDDTCNRPDQMCNVSSKKCEPCGGEGDACCAGGTCDASVKSLVCVRGMMGTETCQPCGASGKDCCSGNMCDSGLMCNGGKCLKCGGPNDDCCDGGKCDSGLGPLVCVTAENKCRQCGIKHDQYCCDGGNCPGPNLVCDGNDNKCKACGGKNEPCCNGLSCGGGFACDAVTKTCIECGGPEKPCCPGNTCDGDMSCSGGKCIGNCSVRCENGSVFTRTQVIDHDACRLYARTSCIGCAAKRYSVARVRYNTRYITDETKTQCIGKDDCCGIDDSCPAGLDCMERKPAECGGGKHQRCCPTKCMKDDDCCAGQECAVIDPMTKERSCKER